MDKKRLEYLRKVANQAGQGFSPTTATPPAAPKKNFWVDQISTVGGILGNIGGAVAGTAVAPGIGTLGGGIAGGSAGSAIGEGIENLITGQPLTKNIGKEAVLGGVFSLPPLRAAKGVVGAVKGLSSGTAKAGFEKGFTSPGVVSKLLSGVNKGSGDVAARTFARAFTVPTKLAARLKPVETAKELLSHGVAGSLSKMSKTADKVTGEYGLITKTTRDAVARIPGDVRTDSATNAAKHALQGSMLSPQEETKIMQTIVGMDKPGFRPGMMHPLDALDNVKQLERIGYQYINSSSKLAPNLKNEQIGRAFIAASDEIKDSLEKAVGKADILSDLKTPELLKQLEKISPKLAQQFMGAKTLSEVRSIAAPFVRLNQMVGLTEDAAQSVGSGLGSGMGARAMGGMAGFGMGGMAGFGMGGPLGAAAGMVAAPFVEGAEQALRAPLTTEAGSLISNMTSKNLPDLLGNIGSTLPGGIAPIVAKQSLKGLMYPSQQPEAPTEQGLSPQSLLNQSGPSEESLQRVLLEDYVRTGGKNSKKIKDLAAMFGIGQQDQKLSLNQQKGVLAMQNAQSTVDQLESLFNQAGGGQGILGGNLAGGLGKVGFNDAAKVYNDKRAGAATLLARALGESGTMTDQDIQRAVSQIPSLAENPDAAARKWQAIKELLASIGQNTLSIPSTSDSGDLLSQLNGAQ